MAKVLALTETDTLLLQRLIDREKQQIANVRNRPELDDDLPDTPEVYLAFTPPTGIPAMGEPAGTGSPDVFTPGSAICNIYRMLPGQTVDFVNTGATRTVYNITTTAIPGATLVLIERDKFGQWFSCMGASATGGGGGVAGKIIRQIYKTPGTVTWTKPADLTFTGVRVRALAAGGAGGSLPASGSGGSFTVGAGSGGGAGSPTEATILAASLSATESVVVGAGGTPAYPGTLAGNGGDSSFGGTLCAAKGGLIGSQTTTSTGAFGQAASYALGGAGGVSTSGDVLGAGESGDVGFLLYLGSSVVASGPGLTSPKGGAGGSTQYGGGGRAVWAAGAGSNGTGYGSGGGGAASSLGGVPVTLGGAGAGGLVIVDEYYGITPQ